MVIYHSCLKGSIIRNDKIPLIHSRCQYTA
uniref:Uncharacterized protein n=1 Tax=Arundo donax TaxID=35708 RepID=A0A0A9HJ30_ARUDO